MFALILMKRSRYGLLRLNNEILFATLKLLPSLSTKSQRRDLWKMLPTAYAKVIR